MQPAETQNDARHAAILIGIGILWLLLAAILTGYQVLNPARVEITWETATEQNTAGFNLYRSTDREGDFVLVNVDEFIPGEGSAVSGASYRYSDSGVEAGQTYYYVLEEIETDGSRLRYEDDLFEYAVPTFIWWLVLLAAVSAVAGLAMVMTGIREAGKR